MSRNLRSFVLSILSLSLFAAPSFAQSLAYVGEGVRQNTTLYTFDSYKLVHHASSFERSLSPHIERSLHLTMLSDFGTFFTKEKMVEALEQALQANTSASELGRLSGEIVRFKKTMLSLPIGKGTELKFNHSPNSALQIQMKGPRGFVTVFQSSDQNFSMDILSIWLGNAHPDANNRDSLVRLTEGLWKNAQ